MNETNFTQGPDQKFYSFVLWFWSTFSRIQALRATFKAVLIAVDMTKALHTKCKTCFEGPRMIPRAPPVWLKTILFLSFFFLVPFPWYTEFVWKALCGEFGWHCWKRKRAPWFSARAPSYCQHIKFGCFLGSFWIVRLTTKILKQLRKYDHEI